MKTASENTKKDAQIAAMSEEIAQLKHQLDWFKRQLFGRKSEKVSPATPHQNSLFDAPVSDEAVPALKPA